MPGSTGYKDALVVQGQLVKVDIFFSKFRERGDRKVKTRCGSMYSAFIGPSERVTYWRRFIEVSMRSFEKVNLVELSFQYLETPGRSVSWSTWRPWLTLISQRCHYVGVRIIPPVTQEYTAVCNGVKQPPYGGLHITPLSTRRTSALKNTDIRMAEMKARWHIHRRHDGCRCRSMLRNTPLQRHFVHTAWLTVK